MNNERRKRIAQARALVEQASGPLKEAIEILSEVRDEEQDAFDALPEGFQAGERGQSMEAAIDALGIVDELEGIDLEDVLNKLDEAAE